MAYPCLYLPRGPSTQIPYNVDNLSPFSSFGPLRDGRIKPDIIAPGGNIESAKSDGKIAGGGC